MSSSHDRYRALEPLLRDILSAIKPLEEDEVTRVHVINGFTAVVNSVESLKGATVEPFGSFISNLYTKWGDLDISIEVESGSVVSSAVRKRKVKLLGDLLRALRKGGFAQRLEFIRFARVPVLKFQSNHRDISCDISICNLMGQIKSKFLLWIAGMDERFRDMVLLVKEWAKAQSINNPKTGTLNSYSLALLVIFHFQTCEPAILPPLHEIYTGNIADDLTGDREVAEKRIQEICVANIARFQTKMARNLNKSSLAELFTSFFWKFSRITTTAAEHVICTYTGQWELKQSNALWMSKTYPLLIEDPFEQPENVARAVSGDRLMRIAEAFARTYSILSGNQDKSSLIATLVESHIRSQFLKRPRGNPNVNADFVHRPQFSSTVHSSRHQSQNMRLESHPPPNYHFERPQFYSSLHPIQNQLPNLGSYARSSLVERPQFSNPAYPTQDRIQNRQFEAYPLQNGPSQGPFHANTLPPTQYQYQYQNMQYETHPSPNIPPHRPQFSSTVLPVRNQHQSMQSETRSTSSGVVQRPGQAVRGSGQQSWRPRYS